MPILRHILVIALVAAFASTIADAALAQNYPSRPIRLVVGYPPGGGSDTLARIVSARLAAALGQQVIVDNRTGAAGIIATTIAAQAQPDGYTLLWGYSTPLVVNPSFYKNLPYDSDRDFAPIALLGSTQYILVVSRSEPADSLKGLVALLKSKPGQFSYASTGVGSPNHLAAELFKARAGISMVHVPYKGGGSAALAVLSGEVKLLFASFASALPQLRAGTLRALAVTGPTRSAEVPNVPTMQESGFPGFDVRAWYGLLAPAGTPAVIVTRLNRESLSMLAQSDVKEALRREGLETSGSTPQEFAARIKAEKGFWAKVIKDAGIKPE